MMVLYPGGVMVAFLIRLSMIRVIPNQGNYSFLRYQHLMVSATGKANPSEFVGIWA